MVVHGEQEQRAAVFAFVADAPALVQLVRKVFNRRTPQRVDGDHGKLGVSPLIDFGAQGVDLRLGVRVEKAGEVAHIPLWPEVLDLLRATRCRHAQDCGGREGNRSQRS